MPLTLIFFLAIASFVRLWLAMLFPITADESYYWLWAKHLSLSYVDHPPMVALINFLTTFGQANLLGLRIGVVIISLLVSILIYFLAKEAFNEKVAIWSVVLFQLLPHFLIIWLTMFVELPLVLFWTASLLILLIIVKNNNSEFGIRNSELWIFLGITVGLGYLSKYTMFLFWPCLVLFFLLSPENQSWLKKKEPYLALLISCLFFLPVIIWNSQHGWASFLFHTGKASADPWGKNFLPFVADQLVHFTPFLLFAIYGLSKYALKKDAASKLLFSFSAPFLLLFFILSFKIKIWAHWPSAGYIALIPLAVSYLMETGKAWKKFMLWVTLFSSLILIVLLWLSPGVLWHQKDYAQDFAVGKYLPQDKLFSKTNVSSSLLEFYSGRPVYMATGFLKIGDPWGQKQYGLWGIPQLKKGESITYFGDDNELFQQLALANFERVRGLPDPHLALIEDYIGNNYRFFRLEGYMGGTDHP
jgi:4-amino-4-deoxy-L-arabinose transferase-like glycosyltransferase